MKKFKFKYSPLVWVLLTIVILLGVTGLIWNVYNFVYLFPINSVKTVFNGLIVLFNLFFVVFVVSVTTYGRYVVKGDKIYCCMGIIRSVYDVKEVVQFSLFKKSNKLVMYFSDAKYTVIVISPDDYERFILAVREINPQIIYDTRIDGEETPQ